ncbi:hypothetical protein LJC27_06185 [Christensenellaceae bacterium OttesenSCG-928-M15]|nr:hypothetical protein [Christensenellaceae bacterium OttesenSCG-928-M15]
MRRSRATGCWEKESQKNAYKVAIYCRVGSKEQLSTTLVEQPLRERIENTQGRSYVNEDINIVDVKERVTWPKR